MDVSIEDRNLSLFCLLDVIFTRGHHGLPDFPQHSWINSPSEWDYIQYLCPLYPTEHGEGSIHLWIVDVWRLSHKIVLRFSTVCFLSRTMKEVWHGSTCMGTKISFGQKILQKSQPWKCYLDTLSVSNWSVCWIGSVGPAIIIKISSHSKRSLWHIWLSLWT